MNLLQRGIGKTWLLIGITALTASAFVQKYVEHRRVASNLTWTDPQQKQALEVGFLALGGFRGILADVLWIRAIRHQDSKQYYELKLLCDMILRLQPTFTQVHAFQAYNMSYNLAFRGEGCEDKWYWIRSGIATLEKGLERNKHNYALWFELGYQYFDRLSDLKMAECKEIRQRELPRLEDLNDKQRERVFLGEKTWESGRARADEHLRFASYYFWRAMETHTDPTPLRTERQYGQCIERIGHWYPSKKPPEELRKLMEKGECKWDDWGAEDWWVELIRRNKERDNPNDTTCPTNLKFCLYQQLDFYQLAAKKADQSSEIAKSVDYHKRVRDALERFHKYFPEDKRSLEEILKQYREYRDRPEAKRSKDEPLNLTD
jgi:hypothetical protein